MKEKLFTIEEQSALFSCPTHLRLGCGVIVLTIFPFSCKILLHMFPSFKLEIDMI